MFHPVAVLRTSEPETPKVERVHDDAESRRMWKRSQMVATLPEKDQRAVIRLINSLVSLSSRQPLRKAG